MVFLVKNQGIWRVVSGELLPWSSRVAKWLMVTGKGMGVPALEAIRPGEGVGIMSVIRLSEIHEFLEVCRFL